MGNHLMVVLQKTLDVHICRVSIHLTVRSCRRSFSGRQEWRPYTVHEGSVGAAGRLSAR